MLQFSDIKCKGICSSVESVFQFKVSCDQVSCQGQLLLASLVSELQGWLDAVCISYMGKTEWFIFISSESSLECYWYQGVCSLSCSCASVQPVQKGNWANFSGLPRSQSICLTCSCRAEDLSPIRHSVTFVFSSQMPWLRNDFPKYSPRHPGQKTLTNTQAFRLKYPRLKLNNDKVPLLKIQPRCWSAGVVVSSTYCPSRDQGSIRAPSQWLPTLCNFSSSGSNTVDPIFSPALGG